METMKCLIESMKKEICAAECYYMKALNYKDVQSSISATYVDVASQELDHFMKFYSVANSYLAKKKTEAGDSTPIQMIWEYEHGSMVDDYNELKYKLSKLV